MMTSVHFRGELIDVDYKIVEEDPTTNTLEIEWSFVDEPDPPATADESDAIYCELAAIEPDYFDDDVL